MCFSGGFRAHFPASIIIEVMQVHDMTALLILKFSAA